MSENEDAPQEWAELLERVRELSAAEKPEEAAHLLKKFTAANPEHARAHNSFGSVCLVLGNLELAEQHLQRALSLDASIPETHYNLAIWCKKKQLDNQASVHLDEAIALNPRFSAALLMRGHTALREGEYESAIEDFSMMIQCDATDAALWRWRSVARFHKSDFGMALKDVDQAESLAGPQAWIEDTRGCILAAMQRFKEAIDCFQKAIELTDEDNANDQCGYRVHLANALESDAQDEAALAILNEACNLDPKCVEAFQARGNILEKLGRGFEALQDIYRVEKLDKKHADNFVRKLQLERNLRESEATISQTLSDWMQLGGRLPRLNSHQSQDYVQTESEVKELASAIQMLADQGPAGKLDAESLSELVSAAQMIPDESVAKACQVHCLPIFNTIVEEAFDGKNWPPECVMEILRLLTFRGDGQEYLSQVVRAIKSNYQCDSYGWVAILSFMVQDPARDASLLSQLREPPRGKIAAILVNSCNLRCENGMTQEHLFDSALGVEILEKLLVESEDGDYWLTAVVAAIPYLSAQRAGYLSTIAGKHESLQVQVIAAWALAKRGDKSQIDKLCEYALDFRCADQALGCLDELGMSARVPPKAREDESRAKAAFASWLVHPNELAAYPDEIQVYDRRTLYWPPTDDTRELWILRFCLKRNGVVETGVGMVGSVTFVLFGEELDGKPVAEVYLKHCAWEMQQKGMPGDAAEILYRENPDLLS
ncbi:MAG: hypothetical protein Aurels2KO_42640 [Aureliella sp.]